MRSIDLDYYRSANADLQDFDNPTLLDHLLNYGIDEDEFVDKAGEYDLALALGNGFELALGELYGEPTDYQLGNAPEDLPAGTAIFKTTWGENELMAIVVDNSALSVEDDCFSFV
ncbi:hypothetical protein [Phormidium sp. CCY1219]|uniref:hypothetical protein n=1 Tax=Phormidium sp. CCY1219 TaxID=2886104 RepID=UPI002D1EAA45|nr:hypothetical protein [Phormidium sp. CCY1219]MEB3829301.1 hypothetical protein [Phormidium sp. CCY1219]